MLIWLTGLVGWLLLRPYRRITQLGGKDSTAAITSAGRWHRLFLRDVREAATLKVIDSGGTKEPVGPNRRRDDVLETQVRPESRTEDSVVVGASSARPEQARSEADRQTAGRASRGSQRGSNWEAPDVHDDAPPSYSIYRPDSDRSGAGRTPVRRPESAKLPG